MTGAPKELDTPRQEPQQGNADIFISPTEGQRRAAAIQRRRRIGKHLSEALIAAIVGGVVTIMVWHQSAPPTAQNTETKTVVMAAADTKALAAQGAALAPQAGIQSGALAPKADLRGTAADAQAKKSDLMAAAKPEAQTGAIASGAPVNLATGNGVIDPIHPIPMATAALQGRSGADELAEDAIGAEMEHSMDDPATDGALKDKAKAPIKNSAAHGADDARQVPILKAKSEPARPEMPIPATAKAPAMPKMEAKAAPIPAPKAAPAHPVEAKAAAPALASAAPKADAKAVTAPKAETKAGQTEAKVTFPAVQADGHFLVTAGSYSNMKGAEKIQKKLADAGIPVRMRKSMVNNHTVHHLLTGPFASAEIATQAVATIKERTGVDARFVSMPDANLQAAKSSHHPVTAAKPVAAKDNAAKDAQAKSAPVIKETVAAKAPVAKDAKVAVAVAEAPAVKETAAKRVTVAKAAPAKEVAA
ncbi:MAG: SPOR domain-containing protein, partial [Magnetococcales bacterium]|nr:SPOR domain-containing protein [Magnetococcales bacterium]